jgi:hypothetical protein
MQTGHILNTVISANLFDGMVALLGLPKLLCHYQPKLIELHLHRDNFLVNNAGVEYSNINKIKIYSFMPLKTYALVDSILIAGPCGQYHSFSCCNQGYVFVL